MQDYITLYCIQEKNHDIVGYSKNNWNTSGYNYYLNEYKLVEPLPYYDYNTDLGKFFRETGGNTELSWLFSFENKEKFEEWFDPEFRNLAKNKYDLYLVNIPKDRVIFGTKQCIFFTKDLISRWRTDLI